MKRADIAVSRRIWPTLTSCAAPPGAGQLADADWSAATWDGSRREQHLAFRRLLFADKLRVIEDLAATADLFLSRRTARCRQSIPGRSTGSPEGARGYVTPGWSGRHVPCMHMAIVSIMKT